MRDTGIARHMANAYRKQRNVRVTLSMAMARLIKLVIEPVIWCDLSMVTIY
jgi:hypothetical protein